MFGVRTKGPMAPEIPLEGQRPAQYVFSRHVERMLAKIGDPRPGAAIRASSRPQSVVSPEPRQE